jgi:hypothetical protein
MGTDPLTNPDEMTEEQLRAAYEQEIKRVRVEHVLLENIVTIINLGMRRTGLMEGTEDERDLGQVTLAVESVRALMPQIELVAPDQVEPIRQALSQLQLGFVRAGGGSAYEAPAEAEPGAAASGPRPPAPEGPGPAQQSGRLWLPGQ